MNDVERDLRELFETEGRIGRWRGAEGPSRSGSVAAAARSARRSSVRSRSSRCWAYRSPASGQSTELRHDVIPADDPWADYEVFERTAPIGNFTVTSPSDLYLVDQWWIGAHHHVGQWD